MSEDNDSAKTTNRRKLLGAFASGTIATSLIAWTASASDVSPQNCEEERTEYRCVDSACDCSECGCECDTIREQRSCCIDRYGNVVFCSSWSSTGNCCTSC